MKLKHAFLLLTTTCILFSKQTVKAQSNCFTIADAKGCAPFTAQVTDCSFGPGRALVFYKLDNGSFNLGSGSGTLGATTPFSFAGPGTYDIVQSISVNAGFTQPPQTAVQKVTVITAVKPTFTVKLCSSRQVSVTITNNTYDNYTIDYGDGFTDTGILPNSTTTHPYPDLSPRTIIVTGKFASGNDCGVASQSVPLIINPIAAYPTPDITFLEVTKEGLSNGEIQVGFNTDPNATYRYDLMSGTTIYPQLYQNLTGDPRFSYNAGIAKLININTLNEFQCLKIRALDACSGAAVAQNEICSIRSFDVQAQNLQNQLTWTAYPDATAFSSFETRRNNAPLSSGASSPFIDNNVVCATNYCYRIKTFLNSTSSIGTVYSLSANKCVDAISTTVPTAVTNVNSTINSTNTQVVFDAPVGFTVKKYFIFDGNGNTVNSGTSNNVSFAGSPGTCYRVAYDDNCNTRSIVSPFTCTVNLIANLADDGSIALHWSPYSGYLSTGIASYDVLFLNENNQILKIIPAGLGLSASDIPSENAGRLFYKIRINSGGTENIVSYSNLVEVSLEPTIFIPNAFTPNGDGTNDTFIAKSRFVKNLEMTIYNRWGEPVFKTTDIKTGWDGKVNGTDAPIGSYAYIIKIEGNKGESSTERGSISLIR